MSKSTGTRVCVEWKEAFHAEGGSLCPCLEEKKKKIVEVLIVSGSGQNQMKPLDNFPRPNTHKKYFAAFHDSGDIDILANQFVVAL